MAPTRQPRRAELIDLLEGHAADLDAGAPPEWVAQRLKNLARVMARTPQPRLE